MTLSGRSMSVVMLLAISAGTVLAQEPGVRVGITYTPGTLPTILVLGGERSVFLDSVRTILRRDFEQSDRFELITLPGGDSLAIGTVSGGDGERLLVNYQLYAALGAEYAVDVRTGPDSAASVTAYDVRGATSRGSVTVPAGSTDDDDFRVSVHRAADEVTRLATGQPGIAASRLAFIRGGQLFRVDFDGAREIRIPTSGRAYSPMWHPTGTSVAWVEFPGSSAIRVQNLDGSGVRELVPGSGDAQNLTPSFSADGRLVVFARAGSDGTDVYSYDAGAGCCLQRLTTGRFSDNLSPTFGPGGRQIAFVSTRPGLPQVYVMAADGTGQELFAPFDFGVTGSSYAPEWSPDGLNLAFHRDVQGVPQIFIMDVATRSVRQLTSAGRNEDPTWAPDGRHLAFASDRTGSSQIWVIDLETGRIRQLTRGGGTRLPAWSPRLSAP